MMTKRDFWKLETPKNIRGKVTIGVVCCFISAAMTALVAVAISPFLFFDVVLLVALALGILLAKSRICAVVLLGYFIISKLMQPGMGLGEFNAVSAVTAIAFAAGYAASVVGTFQFQSLWKQYKQRVLSEAAPEPTYPPQDR